jgi:hypothetical protein
LFLTGGFREEKRIWTVREKEGGEWREEEEKAKERNREGSPESSFYF